MSSPNIDAIIKQLSPEEMVELLTMLDELENRQRVQAAQQDFLAFIALLDSKYKFGAHLKRLGHLLMDMEAGAKDRVAVSMPPRFGKLLADDTPVWTPAGWKMHGDLQVGDFVYHPSGRPVRVIAVSEKGPADMRVETTDGAVLYCHERHEWTVRKRNNGTERPYVTLETAELAAVPLAEGPAGMRGGRYIYQLPARSPCLAPDADLPIHPYFLGAWLGDGTASRPRITHSAADQPYIDRLVALGYPISTVNVHTTTGVHTTSFAVGGKGRGNGSNLLYALRALGVLNNKHIPVAYLTASVDQRLQLLAGLIDSDGTRDSTGRYTVTTASAKLAADIATLVRSLGWRAGITEVAPCKSSSGIQGTRPYFMVAFNPTFEIPVVLERKKFLRPPTPRSVAIKSVRKDPQGKVGKCIQVDAADGLYLVGETLTPTHNSQMISIYYPAWYLGRNPTHKVIMASHTADLAIDMARKVRNLMQTAEYQRIFPGVAIAADAKAAGKWNTSKGGEFYAVGVGGALAGRGGDLIIIDDPISEQALKSGDFDSLDTVYEWFRAGLRTRLMPGGRLVILHTRWHQRDLIGRLLKDAQLNPDADQYEMFEFPAILNAENPPDHPTHPPKSLWPEQWPLESLLRTKASMPLWQWNAQYMQDPTARDSAIIKREWIRWWSAPRPPKVEFIVQAWDTALTTKERSDWSVCQTWGVWTPEDSGVPNVILLNRAKGKWEFPDLKAAARAQYEQWQPDSVIVEAKASGQPLIDEMRRSGIFVQDYSPGKGQDKLARLNAVTDMFSSGQVWVPETAWADEVVEEWCAFPNGEHDDEVDALTLALMRIRKGGLLRLASDPEDNWEPPRRRGAYTV